MVDVIVIETAHYLLEDAKWTLLHRVAPSEYTPFKESDYYVKT